MGKKLSDFVIISDIDGTLLDRQEGIPKRNIVALERFTAAGGRFAVATGRSLVVARPVVSALPVNFPCVIFNGGATYDHKRRAFIDKIPLPETIGEHFANIWRVFPDCGVVLVGDEYVDIDGITQRKHGWWLKQYKSAGSRLRPAKLSEVTGFFFKVFLVLPPEQCRQLSEYLRENAADFQGVRFVFSDTTMFEMLPEGSSKGSAIERLAAITGVERENIVAIGDYYNDLEMLEYAGLSAAPADAPEDIKAAVDLIVCPCGEGALADLVEYLEERYT